MKRSHSSALFVLSVGALLLSFAPTRADDDLDALQEKAIKAAVARVAPSVVQIETSGGTEIVSTGPKGPRIRKGVGPTSGVVVAADGYVISSAFNFANKPTSIIVAVAGQEKKYVAKVVATDQTRMLSLLKLEGATGLVVPTAVPKNEIQIGQTSIAVGRTLAGGVEMPPSVSVGIISALNRVWGKAVQTDAKVSPVNYGGPLIDLTGRVQGVLVPASPRAEGETAGLEWYDSGIGFAIPLEDINGVLERLKQGKDLKKGLLMGLSLQAGNEFGTAPVVGGVAQGSPAEKAGFKIGDKIMAVDGKAVASKAQLQHQIGYRYEGDTVAVKLLRGKEEVNLAAVPLSGTLAAFGQAFLGILPIRDDTAEGIEVRYVYKDSPADKAGLKVGDRIVQFGFRAPGEPESWQKIKGRDELLAQLDNARPGSEYKLEVLRKEGGKKEELKVTLVDMPEAVPEELPKVASKMEGKKPEVKEGDKAPDLGLLRKTTAAADHGYFVYVPENYNPAIAHALVIWLHPLNKNKDRDIDDFVLVWGEFCETHHIIVVGPRAEGETGWTPGDADFVQESVKTVMAGYNVDKRRVVAHGMGQGGQFAFFLGFNARPLIRGVAVTGAALGGSPKEKSSAQPLAFYLVAGGKDPIKDAIKDSRTHLLEGKYTATYREIAEMGHQYLDLKTLEELIRWIDTLDRM